MASPVEKVESPELVVVDGDMLGPESVDPKHPQVDPDPSTSKQVKEQDEGGKKECGKDADNIKTTILISGAVVAAIGVIFAIIRKTKDA